MNQPHPKVIQIAVTYGEDVDLLYALRDDGSLWVCRTNWTGKDGDWNPIEPPSDPPHPTRIPD